MNLDLTRLSSKLVETKTFCPGFLEGDMGSSTVVWGEGARPGVRPPRPGLLSAASLALPPRSRQEGGRSP